MNATKSILDWIAQQQTPMLKTLQSWCDVNSHTFNIGGLDAVRRMIAASFQVFDEKIQFPKHSPFTKITELGTVMSHDLADGLYLCKRPQAPHQVICVIHMDTVFSRTHLFQTSKILDIRTLQGPGAADAKGGIAVLLLALQAFEKSEYKDKLGWQVFLNTDEEIGSPGSTELLKEYAKRAQVAFVYEPALPDGQLVSERKGSGNFTLVAKGRAAHAGRDFYEGRNAVYALAKCVIEISDLTDQRDSLTVNVGKIQGGEAHNIVPDLAVIHFNVRLKTEDDQRFVRDGVREIIGRISQKYGVKIELHGDFQAPPRVWTPQSERLFHLVKSAGQDIGLDIAWRPSGGVCDGNRLAACGLATVDSLGVQGGNLHNDQEYMVISSLTERAQLSYLLLTKIANGELA